MSRHMNTLLSAPHRHIGFFEFYDVDRRFGFIGTNGVLFEERATDVNTLIGVYVNAREVFKKELKSQNMWPPFSDDDWVTFEVKNTHKSLEAINLHDAKSSEGLEIALKYYWQHHYIIGSDPRNKNHYNKNIIIELLKSFLKKEENANAKLVTILCTCLEDISDKDSFLETILSGAIFNLISECFLSLPEDFDQSILPNFDLVRDRLLETFVSAGNWQALATLWHKGMTLKLPNLKLTQKLLTQDSADCELFFDELSLSELADCFAGADLCSITWDLAQAIYTKIGAKLGFVFPQGESGSDPLRFFLFLSGQINCLAYIIDWPKIVAKLAAYPLLLTKFFDRYASIAAEEPILEYLAQNSTVRAAALRLISEIQEQVDLPYPKDPPSDLFITTILSYEFAANAYDLESLGIWFGRGISLSFCYPQIVAKLLAESNQTTIQAFFQYVYRTIAKELLACILPEQITWILAQALYATYNTVPLKNLCFTANLSDPVLFFLYLGGQKECLKEIREWNVCLDKVDQVYLKRYAWQLMHEDVALQAYVLDHMEHKCLACLFNTLDDVDLLATLTNFVEINASATLAATLLLQEKAPLVQFRQKCWENLRKELPYITFDLECTREDTREFAFVQDGEMRSFSGQEDLPILLQHLQSAEIIVGHNIKQWALPLLEERGLTSSAFIWDTLEIELLLDPCRYAYSLLTQHKAPADTELIDQLFWDQLYRLAKHPDLCQALKDYFPHNITAILTRLNTQPYREFFAKSATSSVKFFQDRLKPAQATEAALQQCAASAAEGRVLLIAPRSLWPDLALRLSLSFPLLSAAEMLEYRIISTDALAELPPNEPLVKAFLQSFCAASVTPIVANIPQYLRVESLTNDLLQQYTALAHGPIDCVDLDVVNNLSALADSYVFIAAIDSAAQNRLHKINIGSAMTFSDFMAQGFSYPFRMSLAGCVALTQAELDAYFTSKFSAATYDAYTANVWIERQNDGRFLLYKNYFYTEALEELATNYAASSVYTIPWEYESSHDIKPLKIAISKKEEHFDSAEYRVNPDSPYRGEYWVAQVAFLTKIHEQHSDLPIVFVTDTLAQEELAALRSYIESCGFVVLQDKGGLKDLELAIRQQNSLILLDQDTFASDIGTCRTDRAFCVVWDNLGVERLRVMWKHLPFPLEHTSYDSAESAERIRHTTISECIEAVLPLFTHYASMLCANHQDSCFYLLEPAFDLCQDMLRQLGEEHVKAFSCVLWTNKEEWQESKSLAQSFFTDLPWGIANPTIDLQEAKTHILKMLIGDNKQWRAEQEPVLDFMLQKSGDCIVSMPTGGGKSVLFQGPALYLSYYTKKLSLVVTPLRALMQDQVAALEIKGFEACVDFINSDLSYAEVLQIYRRIRSGGISLLYITPERFSVKSFMRVLTERIEHDGGLEYIVFDEAHCIAQWGNEFRPDYYNAYKMCVAWKEQYALTIALFSATITEQERIVGLKPAIFLALLAFFPLGTFCWAHMSDRAA